MATLLELANQALYKVGAEPITSFPNTTSERGRVVSASWPFVRQAVLRDHDWNVATTRTQLTANVTAPTWGFDGAYDIPADSLRILEVDVEVPWRIEGAQILTDGTGDIDVRYVRDITDPLEFDAELLNVMVIRLAAEIVERVTNSRSKREQLTAEYVSLLSDAKMDDGEEQSEAEFEEDSWVEAHFGVRRNRYGA